MDTEVKVKATPENIKAGDIVYATYYYNRVSHTFYKVLECCGKLTAVLQKLDWIYHGGQLGGTEEPGDPIGSPFSVRYGKHGFKTDRYLSALYVWNGKPLTFESWD